MPSWDHEGIVELFRSDPRLAAELLRGLLGVDLPEFVAARVESGELTQLNPAELRADLVPDSAGAGWLISTVGAAPQRRSGHRRRG